MKIAFAGTGYITTATFAKDFNIPRRYETIMDAASESSKTRKVIEIH